ncbi:MAG: endonuclease/exonuclease/phosphatase family protein, partial [Planctomycetota bacterium]|nr:endonuclease/exonuclease/phosphatase family protein [Planctomycetota bacterium]
MPRSLFQLAAILLLAGGSTMNGCTTSPASADDRESERIRVATWNIRHGRGLDGRVDLERIARVIEDIDADIVALQEVDEVVRRSGLVDQAAWLAERLGMRAVFGSFMEHQGGRYGMAMLSGLPIEHSEVWRLTDGHEPRVALAVRVLPPTGPAVAVVGVHFDWVEDDEFRHRQATETMARLRRLDVPWIVLGDFNDTPGSRTLRDFRALGREALKPKERRATFPADEPRIEIDF